MIDIFSKTKRNRRKKNQKSLWSKEERKVTLTAILASPFAFPSTRSMMKVSASSSCLEVKSLLWLSPWFSPSRSAIQHLSTYLTKIDANLDAQYRTAVASEQLPFFGSSSTSIDQNEFSHDPYAFHQRTVYHDHVQV